MCTDVGKSAEKNSRAAGPGCEHGGSERVIRQEGDQTITEYRVGGRVYMMKVVPARGEPYYLIDKSGEGTFERLPGGAPLSPPMWVIKSWK